MTTTRRILFCTIVALTALAMLSSGQAMAAACCDNETFECFQTPPGIPCPIGSTSHPGKCTQPRACWRGDEECVMLDPLCCWDWGGIPAWDPDAECPERITSSGGYEDAYEPVCCSPMPDLGGESGTAAHAEVPRQPRSNLNVPDLSPSFDPIAGMVPCL